MQMATQYLERAIASRPGYAEARHNLGIVYIRGQRYAEAEQQFLTCIELAPDFANTYISLAQLYLLQRDKAKARATLDTLLKRKPDDAAAKQALAALDQAP